MTSLGGGSDFGLCLSYKRREDETLMIPVLICDVNERGNQRALKIDNARMKLKHLSFVIDYEISWYVYIFVPK